MIPSHTSHILQPLDVGVFLPLKTLVREKFTQERRISQRKITKSTFPGFVSQPFKLAISEKNIQIGFQKSGIFPVNEEIVVSLREVKKTKQELYDPLEQIKILSQRSTFEDHIRLFMTLNLETSVNPFKEEQEKLKKMKHIAKATQGAFVANSQEII